MSGQLRGRIGPWVAVLVLVVGLLLSLAGWRSFRIHEQSELRQATSRAAEAIRIDLLNDIEYQKVGLDRLAMLWEEADPSKPLWTKNAKLYIQHRPGCVAVEWLASDLKKSFVITDVETQRPLAFNGTPKELITAAIRSKELLISSPDPQAAGTRQWIIAYPVFASDRLRGVILSFFDVYQSLDYILADVKNLGFSFAVALPGQPEQVLTGSSRRYESPGSMVIPVNVPGEIWHLRVWPNVDVVSEITSLLPELVLGIGASLSLLMASCLYFVFRLAVSSRSARLANEALQQEIRTRQGAQDELRRAHADLEMRVDQRTAELASTNALLLKEIDEHKHTADLMRDLTSRLFQLQDDERRRLARELHDGATQNLVALSMDIGLIRDAISGHDVGNRELINECIRLVDESTRELRTVSYLLHPPYFDELGLASALRDFVDGFAARSGIRVRLDLDPKLGRLGNHIELGIFRVIQEALSNVHRHAHSRTASIALSRNTELIHVEIADEGCGIPPEILEPAGTRLAGVGLAGMRERIRLLGGRLDIQSCSAGTRIQAVIPVLESTLPADGTGVMRGFAEAYHNRTPAA